MSIDEMMISLQEMKNKLGTADAEVAVVGINHGENDYLVPTDGVVGEFEDQDGKIFKCAFVAKSGGEEFTKKGVPHYKWNPQEDVVSKTCTDFDKHVLHVKMERFCVDDAVVNEEEDNPDRPKIPGFDGHNYCIKWDIDPKEGIILNWRKGTTARVWYKVVDEFSYDYGRCHYGPYYVPRFMAIDDEGWGDYVRLTIDADGKIKNWSQDNFERENYRLCQ